MIRVMVTGRPGVGKTTLVMRVVERVRGRVPVRGFVTLEVREGGSRVGFRIVNVETGDWDWLAHVSLFNGGPRVGRYNVNVEAIDRVGLPAIHGAGPGVLVVIDEIGPMELMSRGLLGAVRGALSRSNLVATVYRGYVNDHALLGMIREFHVDVLELTVANRDALLGELVRRVEEGFNLHRRHGPDG